MKTLLTTLILSLSLSVSAQEYRVPIPNTNLHWKFNSLNDNKYAFTLNGDTLFIHKLISPLKEVKEQLDSTRHIVYKGVLYRFRFAIIDKAVLHTLGRRIEE